MLAGLIKRLFGSGRPLAYEEQRELARNGDEKIRAEMASRDDMRPEILYYLAGDLKPEIRRRVAANKATPVAADLVLTKDKDDQVRADLVTKIARVAPGLTDNEQDRVRRVTYEVLETLARDQVPKIRQILAEALKDVANAPPAVMRRLARDAEIAVAAPVLQYSPVLTDDDLLDIIATSPVAGALAAISRRQGVPVAVADAIAATDDTAAIAELLANKSAQIREETLDRLADRAADFESWHRPLVERPHLSAKAAQRLARFVASSLLESLASRHDLDAETAKAVALVVRRRLDEMAAVGPAKAEAKREVDAAVAMVRARQLLAAGTLDESTVDTALSGGDSAFVEAALSLLSGLPLTVVHKTVSLQSAKGIVAVTWKAKLSPALAVQLQGKLLRLPSTRVLRPVGGDFPLSAKEMDWQIEFLG